MKTGFTHTRKTRGFRILSAIVTVLVTPSFLLGNLIGFNMANAGQILPSTVLTPANSAYLPPVLRGVRVYPERPFDLDFIIDGGDEYDVSETQAKELVKYFLASITIPTEDMWVNLSPYEGDGVMTDELSETVIGRDLLAQDYLLKQMVSSLTHPDTELGQKYWSALYDHLYEKYGTTEVPSDTFNKVWITPEKARIYDNGTQAYITESRLKVMLEEDYALMDHAKTTMPQEVRERLENGDHAHSEASDIMREVIIPALEEEVNHGEHFAPVRQIFNSMLLGMWFKENLNRNIVHAVYADQKKVIGIDHQQGQVREQTHEEYMEAYKQGVYNFIKEEYDIAMDDYVPRKYFSGGAMAPARLGDVAIVTTGSPSATELGFNPNSYAITLQPQASTPVSLSRTVSSMKGVANPFILLVSSFNDNTVANADYAMTAADVARDPYAPLYRVPSAAPVAALVQAAQPKPTTYTLQAPTAPGGVRFQSADRQFEAMWTNNTPGTTAVAPAPNLAAPAAPVSVSPTTVVTPAANNNGWFYNVFGPGSPTYNGSSVLGNVFPQGERVKTKKKRGGTIVGNWISDRYKANRDALRGHLGLSTSKSSGKKTILGKWAKNMVSPEYTDGETKVGRRVADTGTAGRETISWATRLPGNILRMLGRPVENTQLGQTKLGNTLRGFMDTENRVQDFLHKDFVKGLVTKPASDARIAVERRAVQAANYVSGLKFSRTKQKNITPIVDIRTVQAQPVAVAAPQVSQPAVSVSPTSAAIPQMTLQGSTPAPATPAPAAPAVALPSTPTPQQGVWTTTHLNGKPVAPAAAPAVESVAANAAAGNKTTATLSGGSPLGFNTTTQVTSTPAPAIPAPVAPAAPVNVAAPTVDLVNQGFTATYQAHNQAHAAYKAFVQNRTPANEQNLRVALANFYRELSQLRANFFQLQAELGPNGQASLSNSSKAINEYYRAYSQMAAVLTQPLQAVSAAANNVLNNASSVTTPAPTSPTIAVEGGVPVITTAQGQQREVTGYRISDKFMENASRDEDRWFRNHVNISQTRVDRNNSPLSASEALAQHSAEIDKHRERLNRAFQALREQQETKPANKVAWTYSRAVRSAATKLQNSLMRAGVDANVLERGLNQHPGVNPQWASEQRALIAKVRQDISTLSPRATTALEIAKNVDGGPGWARHTGNAVLNPRYTYLGKGASALFALVTAPVRLPYNYVRKATDTDRWLTKELERAKSAMVRYEIAFRSKDMNQMLTAQANAFTALDALRRDINNAAEDVKSEQDAFNVNEAIRQYTAWNTLVQRNAEVLSKNYTIGQYFNRLKVRLAETYNAFARNPSIASKTALQSELSAARKAVNNINQQVNQLSPAEQQAVANARADLMGYMAIIEGRIANAAVQSGIASTVAQAHPVAVAPAAQPVVQQPVVQQPVVQQPVVQQPVVQQPVVQQPVVQQPVVQQPVVQQPVQQLPTASERNQALLQEQLKNAEAELFNVLANGTPVEIAAQQQKIRELKIKLGIPVMGAPIVQQQVAVKQPAVVAQPATPGQIPTLNAEQFLQTVSAPAPSAPATPQPKSLAQQLQEEENKIPTMLSDPNVSQDQINAQRLKVQNLQAQVRAAATQPQAPATPAPTGQTPIQIANQVEYSEWLNKHNQLPNGNPEKKRIADALAAYTRAQAANAAPLPAPGVVTSPQASQTSTVAAITAAPADATTAQPGTTVVQPGAATRPAQDPKVAVEQALFDMNTHHIAFRNMYQKALDEQTAMANGLTEKNQKPTEDQIVSHRENTLLALAMALGGLNDSLGRAKAANEKLNKPIDLGPAENYAKASQASYNRAWESLEIIMRASNPIIDKAHEDYQAAADAYAVAVLKSRKAEQRMKKAQAVRDTAKTDLDTYNENDKPWWAWMNTPDKLEELQGDLDSTNQDVGAAQTARANAETDEMFSKKAAEESYDAYKDAYEFGRLPSPADAVEDFERRVAEAVDFTKRHAPQNNGKGRVVVDKVMVDAVRDGLISKWGADGVWTSDDSHDPEGRAVIHVDKFDATLSDAGRIQAAQAELADAKSDLESAQGSTFTPTISSRPVWNAADHAKAREIDARREAAQKRVDDAKQTLRDLGVDPDASVAQAAPAPLVAPGARPQIGIPPAPPATTDLTGIADAGAAHARTLKPAPAAPPAGPPTVPPTTTTNTGAPTAPTIPLPSVPASTGADVVITNSDQYMEVMAEFTQMTDTNSARYKALDKAIQEYDAKQAKPATTTAQATADEGMRGGIDLTFTSAEDFAIISEAVHNHPHIPMPNIKMPNFAGFGIVPRQFVPIFNSSQLLNDWNGDQPVRDEFARTDYL